MNGTVKVATFGGNGGSDFLPSSVESLALRTGDFVDCLTINGTDHGGTGGSPAGSLTLADGEYINRIEVRSGTYVDRLEFTTNMGHSIEGGGAGGSPAVLENIRLLAICGRSGSYLDQVTFVYFENYAE